MKHFTTIATAMKGAFNMKGFNNKDFVPQIVVWVNARVI